jgi:hypothetical protein
MREGVLEELLAGEVLEIRVMNQRSHTPPSDSPYMCLSSRRPIEQNQFTLQIDDLVEPRPEQIVRSRFLDLRTHRPLRCTTESDQEVFIARA